MKRKFVSLLAALMLAAAPLHAQLLGFSHSVSLVGVMPTGSFAKSVTVNSESVPVFDRSQIGKDASLGIGVSYRLGKSFDMLVGDLMPFAEVGFFWNRIGGDNRDIFDDARSKDPRYRNVPLMVGLQFRYDLSPMVKPYADLGFGIDWFLPCREGWSDDGSKPYYVFKSSAATAWQFGVGAYIGSMVSVGVTYYGLGKHAFDFNEKRTEQPGVPGFARDANNARAEYRRINALALKVAFHF